MEKYGIFKGTKSIQTGKSLSGPKGIILVPGSWWLTFEEQPFDKT